MTKSLIIVESPTKAKTIGKFLGKDFEILASYGHVRDLPNNASEIPAEVKKEKWARLGINVDDNFTPLYIIPDEKKKRVNELKQALKTAKDVYLATDEDREGESISWHLLEVLKPKVPVMRLVFHEITKQAIQHALNSPRAIDENLVRAQETRRIIDRLFGYTVSPLLWKKMAPRLSAGRVQSVAIRLLCEREAERIQFRTADYWDLKGVFAASDSQTGIDAELTHVDGKRVAQGKDFEPTTGLLKADTEKVLLLNKETASSLREKLLKSPASVEKIESKPFTQKPPAPFTTSTLQQDAGSKLSFTARRTMQVAQMLYENGFITYMRTDSTSLSEEAIKATRSIISNDFGKEYLPAAPRLYKTKVKNAQEAHEAIRPAGESFATFNDVKAKLGAECFRLYELIWKRTLASQMLDAEGTRVSVSITCDTSRFRASGKTITFPGFLRAYVEGSDDPEADLADKERILPPLVEGQSLVTRSITALGHTTQPPARYTEGSLIKKLEELGIGRPSTWATIVDVVMQRTYAFKKGTALVPTHLAMAVTGLMSRYFQNVVDYEFTAKLEEDLDAISRGEADSLRYLADFYTGKRPGLLSLVSKGEEIIDPREVCGLPVGSLENGKTIEVRIGRYGPFLSDGETRASLPGELPPDELTLERAAHLLDEARKGPSSLGAHPSSGKPVYLKSGRFGPYIQEGDGDGDEKPHMASLLKGMIPSDVTLDVAVQLLSLPRSIGVFPDNNETIEVHNGRYGPYVKAGSETRTLPDDVSPLDVTTEVAITILRQPRARGRASAQPKNLKEIGIHPVTERKMVLRAGRYGPYITDGEVNASLPASSDPETITLEEAAQLISERAAKVGNAPKKVAKKKASKKVSAKAPPMEKAPSKKTPTKKKSTAKKKAAAKK